MIKFLIYILIVTSTVNVSSNLLSAEHQLKDIDKQNLREFISTPVLFIVNIYREFAGKGIKSHCPMFPSCSTYGLIALRRIGPYYGTLAIIDRLNRCNHDTYLYPLKTVNGSLYYYDPVPRIK